jgi:hypothetical protein
MPKQAGIIKFSGTIDQLTFYELYGDYYVRRKTSLDKNRVMQDPAFENSRKRMVEFGVASKFCSPIYHSFAPMYKGKGIQQKMSGRAHSYFLQGKSEEYVRMQLIREFGGGS